MQTAQPVAQAVAEPPITASMPLGRAARALFAAEMTLFWREPFGLFFTLFFPVLLLLFFGTIFGDEDVGGGFRMVDFYAPGLLAMVLGTIGLMALPLTIANYREEGILKRYQVSPMPLWALLGVHIAVHGAMFLVSTLLVLGVGVLVFSIPLQANWVGFAIALAVGFFTLCAIGLALASVTSSVRTIQAVGNLVYFLLFFTSGLASPRDALPGWMQPLANNQPMARMVDMFAGLWFNEPLSNYWVTLLILLATGAGAAWLVRALFRWQP